LLAPQDVPVQADDDELGYRRLYLVARQVVQVQNNPLSQQSLECCLGARLLGEQIQVKEWRQPIQEQFALGVLLEDLDHLAERGWAGPRPWHLGPGTAD
jgi:hypothetical protein